MRRLFWRDEIDKRVVRRRNSNIGLDKDGPLSTSCTCRTQTTPLMWPIQTLTLLLCLTDDEQLFAQRIQEDPTPVKIEVSKEADQEQDCDYIKLIPTA